MSLPPPINFPSEAEALRKHLGTEKGLSAQARLRAVADALAAAETLSQAGQVRTAQMKYHEQLEAQWQQRMKEIVSRHVIS
jgi:uncharacterized protein YggE